MLDNKAMAPGLAPRLQVVLDTEPRNLGFSSGLKRTIRVAKFLRIVGIVAVLGFLASIAAPIRISPQSARAWGIAGLVIFASGVALFRAFHGRTGPEEKQQAL